MTSRAVSTNRDTVGVSVALLGFDDLYGALRQLAPQVARQLDREIKSIIEPIAVRARELIPDSALSNWAPGKGGAEWGGRLAYDPAAIRSGIKVRKGGRSRSRTSGVRVAYSIVNTDPGGVIFELAGKASASTFAENLSNSVRPPSRAIWEAWDQKATDADVERRIVAAVDRAEKWLQAEFDGAGR